MEDKQIKGSEYLKKINASTEETSIWAKNISYLIAAIVGAVLTLGIDIGGNLTSFVQTKNALETTALSQNGALETTALEGLIESNKGMSEHIASLILSIDNLIEENQALSSSNADANKKISDLSEKITELEQEVTTLKQENSGLKGKIEGGT